MVEVRLLGFDLEWKVPTIDSNARMTHVLDSIPAP
jgi:hypothetical protein